MSAQPDGVRVLITGGTSGLGVAMAAALLDAGAALAVTGRDAARAEAAARNLGRGAIGIGMDVRTRSIGEWTGPSRALAVSTSWSTAPTSGCVGSTRTSSPNRSHSGWSPPGGFRDLADLGGYFFVARVVVPGGRRRPGGERHDEPRDNEPQGVRALRPGTGRCRGTLPDHGHRPRWQPGDGAPPAARRRGGHRVDP